MAEAAPTEHGSSVHSVDPVVERAVGALMAGGQPDAVAARRHLENEAERHGRTTVEQAQRVLADTVAANGPAAARLVDTYVDIGAAIAARPGVEALQVITDLARDHLPGADWTSITILHRDKFESLAVSDPVARRADRLQRALGQGPSIGTAEPGATVVIDDLAEDVRWPDFTRRAATNLGVNALLSFRLRLDTGDLDDAVASLNAYSSLSGAFDRDAVSLGTMLAVHASSALIQFRQRDRMEQMEGALQSNRQIGMAIGILMQRHGVTMDSAFALLRISSQHTNRKLRDVAAELYETGSLILPSEPPPRD